MQRTQHAVLSTALAIVAASPLAGAATTAWNNPKGGAWNDAANWSAGVPGPNDTAVLPELAGQAYTVLLPAAASIQSLEVGSHAGATLHGTSSTLAVANDAVITAADAASLRLAGVACAVAGSFRIGSPAGGGALAVAGSAHLSATLIVGDQSVGTCLVDGGSVAANGVVVGSGTGASGTLTIRSGGTLVAGPVWLGTYDAAATIDVADAGSSWTAFGDTVCSATGPSLLRVTWPATANVKTIYLSASSTLDVLAQPGMQAAITATFVYPRGRLRVMPIDGYEPSIGTFVPVAHATLFPGSSWGFSWGFSVIETPQVAGQGWYIPSYLPPGGNWGVTVPNAVLGFTITVPAEIPAGFTVPATFTATHLDGSVSGGSELPLTWSSSDPSVAVTQSLTQWPWLDTLAPGTTTLGATVGTVTATMQLDVVPTTVTGTVRASESASGGSGNADSGSSSFDDYRLAISANGRWVAFRSAASNLVGDDGDFMWDVFLKDTRTGCIERISVPESPSTPHMGGGPPAISADGRFVSFAGGPGYDADEPTATGAYVFDRLSGGIDAVSLGLDGQPLNALLEPGLSISGDGRFVTYVTAASNIVPSDVPGTKDVFVFDRWSTTTVRIEGPDGPANAWMAWPSLSADGSTVVFESAATNLVAGDTNGKSDVFAWSPGGSIERISVASDGAQADGPSFYPSVSADGTTVAFISVATNLDPAAPAGSPVFVRHRTAPSTRRLDTAVSGLPPIVAWGAPAISGSGRFVSLMVGSIAASTHNAARYDLAGGAAVLVSETWDLAPSGFTAYFTAIDHSGRSSAFASFSADLAPFDGNNHYDVFVRRMSGAGDLDGDGLVGASDLAILLGAWNATGGAADLDGDDLVGASDLAILLGLWTP